jgi:hypothetical protein
MLLAELAGDCLAEVPLAPTRRIFMAVPCERGMGAVCALTVGLGKRRMLRRFLTQD